MFMVWRERMICDQNNICPDRGTIEISNFFLMDHMIAISYIDVFPIIASLYAHERMLK